MSTTSKPALSVVVPTHSRSDLLRACLESVARFAPAETEVIVVDDCSSGAGVAEVVGAFDGVTELRLTRRSGYCIAANAGVAAARADIVELLNDDTEVTAGWAKAALTCFNDPRVTAVAPLVLQYPISDGVTLIDSAGDAYDHGGFAQKIGNGRPPSMEWLRRRSVFGASGSSAFYRRERFLEAGGFPKHFGAYFEDVDLSFRLQRAGGTIVYEPNSRVFHRGGSSYNRANRRLIEQQSCNEERVWWRNLTNRELRDSSLRHLAVVGGKAMRRWREGTLLPWTIGRLRAWSEIVQSRRHFAATRS